jgi:flagellar protein FlaJ
MGKNISYRLFGNITKPYIGYFDGLKINLKKGLINTPLHEYVCNILLYSLIGFVASIIVSSFFVTILIGSIIPINTVADVIFAYTFSVILSILIGGGVFFIGYYYPSFMAKNINTKIERSLPFAVFYMATSSSSGINAAQIFKALSEKGGIVGNEASKIYNDVKSLGMDLSTAIERAATRTPSSTFSDLLWGMSSIITTGGDMEKYLSGKTKSFMNAYKRSLNEYAKTLALYTEIYITLVIIGSLFFIVLTAMMSPLAGNILLLQTLLVFFMIPGVSAAFIVLVRSISPSE